jgi:metacaspase-1
MVTVRGGSTMNNEQAHLVHVPVVTALAVLLGCGASALRAQSSGYHAPELASNHALLITVSGYKGHELPGVEEDRKTALDISHRLGVPARNILELSEEQVTVQGVREALIDMDKTLLPGDKVFVYFSGHGARRLNKETNQCVESLVMQPLTFLTNREFARMMKPLTAKADKTIVMLDSCFSGGVAQTAAARALEQQRPKSLPPSPECSQAVNARGFEEERGADLGTTDNNMVVLAAARNNEVAWDTAYGGALTYNAERCFTDAGGDAQKSGALSMEDLAACVQRRLDKAQQESSRQHVTLAGNTGLIAGFAASAPGVSASADPAAMLDTIYLQRDDRWQVDASVGQPTLKIGTNLTLSIHSQRAGYVYVFYQGSQPNSFYMLFPNQLDPDDQIAADGVLHLPGPDWSVTALGPSGTDHLLVMVTQSQRDFSKLSLPAEYVSQEGPFEKFQPTTGSVAIITQLATLSAAAKSHECSNPGGARDLGVARRCSSVFGASQLSVEEVE